MKGSANKVGVLLRAVMAAAILAPAALAAAEIAAKPKVEAFEYRDVKLLPGPLLKRFEINRAYLMSLPNTSLLYPFYKEAILRVPQGAQPLGGWEAMSVDVRGHFLGHFLSASARIYATTGDQEIKRKADAIVSELARIQQTNGNGYVGPISEKVFDALEAGRHRDVWAPYYVIHKVLMGLYEMYRHAGNPQALEVARGMADYVKARTDKLSDSQFQHMLEVEFGGMSETLYDLHAATGEKKYLDLARRFEREKILDPLARGEDILTGLHANTQYPIIYGAMRAYELSGEERYRRVAENFWNILTSTRTYATGGSNNREFWGEPNRLKETLSEANQETCTAYNLMWLARYLFRSTGDARYADYYERNFYNGILTAQNPADGQFCYFTPMKAGSTKRFGTPLGSFWCCYGTGVQAYADLAGGIYFHDAESLYVSLFIPSEVSWKRASGTVRLTQETDYPVSGATRLSLMLDSPAEFAVRIRVPWWARKGVEVRVNGEKVAAEAKPSSFLALRRTWKNGDAVDVSMPMSLYAEPLPDDPEMIAVMYGPLVMAGLVFEDVEFRGDRNNLDSWLERAPEEERPRVSHLRVVHDQLPSTVYPEHFRSYYSDPFHEVTLPRERIALTFQTRPPNPRVKFVPLYEILEWPYGIYFRVKP
jgi:hypothetical protein